MGQKDKDFDLEEIKKLTALMTTNGLVEIEITHGDERIFLKREGDQRDTISGSGTAQHPVGSDGSDDLEVINSPIEGTFYRALKPDSEPFVEVGSEVTPQTPLCIIDAMKVLNEITAGTTGTIVEILTKNGQAIEFGQPLFKVKPDQ